MARSLAEFATTVGSSKPRKCFTCRLPEDVLSQVEAARAQDPPVFYRVIAHWLAEEGHQISSFTLRNHFQKRHHEDAR